MLQQLSEITHEQRAATENSRISSAERAYSDAQSARKTLDEQLQQHLTLQPEIRFEALLSQLQSLVEQITQVMEQRDEVKLKTRSTSTQYSTTAGIYRSDSTDPI